MYNYHCHLHYSIDAIGSAEEYCKEALKQGIKYLCFTPHYSMKELEQGDSDYSLTEEEMKQFLDEIKVVRQKFPELDIKIGLEAEYSEGYEEKLARFFSKYDFDFIMGGAHIVDGLCIQHVDEAPKLFEKHDPMYLYEKYFKRVLNLINSGLFDSVAHFDSVRKFSPYIEFEKYKHLVIPCIEAMKEKDVGFELNTMGWRYPNRDSYPNIEILKLLHKAGIKKITIGSDCHKPEDVSFLIPEGLKLLKTIGFKQICVFDGRKERYVDIK